MGGGMPLSPARRRGKKATRTRSRDGSMTREKLSSKRAQKRDIPNRSKMSKRQLENALG